MKKDFFYYLQIVLLVIVLLCGLTLVSLGIADKELQPFIIGLGATLWSVVMLRVKDK